jgi:hypothetical protein
MVGITSENEEGNARSSTSIMTRRDHESAVGLGIR